MKTSLANDGGRERAARPVASAQSASVLPYVGDRVAPPSQRERTQSFVVDMPGDVTARWVKRYRFAAAAWN